MGATRQAINHLYDKCRSCPNYKGHGECSHEDAKVGNQMCYWMRRTKWNAEMVIPRNCPLNNHTLDADACTSRDISKGGTKMKDLTQNDMNANEQWLSDGDCSLCRKREYCKRPCKRAELRKKEQMLNCLFNKNIEVYGNFVGGLLNKGINRWTI